MSGCTCGCGSKNRGAGACAANYENLCDVRADADENPRTLKVCGIYQPVKSKGALPWH